MIVKGFVIFERTLLFRKESHNLAWWCAISDVFYCEESDIFMNIAKMDNIHQIADALQKGL